jgi:hypothetical protein
LAAFVFSLGSLSKFAILGRENLHRKALDVSQIGASVPRTKCVTSALKSGAERIRVEHPQCAMVRGPRDDHQVPPNSKH